MKKTLWVLLAATMLPAAGAKKPFFNELTRELQFSSPSQNILCKGDKVPPEGDAEGYKKGVECSVFSGEGRMPTLPELPTPKDCDVSPGITVFSVEASGPAKREAICQQASYYQGLEDSIAVLPYGETLRGQGWQCTSSERGMHCENGEKNGFDLSRGSQKLFGAGVAAEPAADPGQFDFSGLKKGHISKNCYREPCAVAKLVSFKNRGPDGDGVTVDLELLGGESTNENSPITWNEKTHKVSVHCSKTKPSTTLDGKVEYLPIGPHYPAVLYSAGQLYMETCHNFKSYTVEDGAEKFGYDLENLDGETGEMRPAGS